MGIIKKIMQINPAVNELINKIKPKNTINQFIIPKALDENGKIISPKIALDNGLTMDDAQLPINQISFLGGNGLCRLRK